MSEFLIEFTTKLAWFIRVCIWVTVRLICFRARAQRSGNRNRERREADYDYDYECECDSYVESCDPELNQATKLELWSL